MFVMYYSLRYTRKFKKCVIVSPKSDKFEFCSAIVRKKYAIPGACTILQ